MTSPYETTEWYLSMLVQAVEQFRVDYREVWKCECEELGAETCTVCRLDRALRDAEAHLEDAP